MPLRTPRAPSRSARSILVAWGIVLVLGACGEAKRARPEGWTDTPPVPVRMDELESSVAKRIQRGLDAVRADPDSARAWGDLGMLYEVVVLHGQALECYDQAELRDPTNPRWPYRKGVCRGRMDEARLAIADLERSIELEPNYAPAQYRRGVLALEDGDLALAREAFEEARKIDPEFMGGWVGEARVLLLEDRPAEAVRLLEEQKQRDPDDPKVLQLLNTAYRQAGSSRRVSIPKSEEGSQSEGRFWSDPWQEELRRFRRATKSNRMARLLDAGKAQTVIEKLERRQAKEPEEPSFLPQLAEAYFDVGRVPDARKTYRRLIELEPKNIPARMALARMQVETESPHLALPWLDEVIEIDPNYGPAWAMKGTILAAGTRYAESRPILEHAIELDQRDPELFLWLAKSEAALREWDAAEKHCDRYLERGGGDPMVYLVRARVRAKQGRLEAAQEDLDLGVERGAHFPGQVDTIRRLIEREKRRKGNPGEDES